jgi:hypothetical protein
MVGGVATAWLISLTRETHEQSLKVAPSTHLLIDRCNIAAEKAANLCSKGRHLKNFFCCRSAIAAQCLRKLLQESVHANANEYREAEGRHLAIVSVVAWVRIGSLICFVRHP